MSKPRENFDTILYAAIVLPFWAVIVLVLILILGSESLDNIHLLSAAALVFTSMLISGLPFFLLREMSTRLQQFSEDLLEPHKLLAEQKRMQSFLLDIGLSLASSLSKEKIIRLIINNIVSLFECELGFLLLHDDKTDQFRYEAGFRMDRTLLRSQTFSTADDPALARVAKEKEILVLDLSQAEHPMPFVKGLQTGKLANVTTLVLAPLVVEDRVLGVFEIFCTDHVRQLIKENMMVCSIAVTQAAIALGSAIQSGYAILDRKTMLYNHEYFMIRLREELSRCKRYHQSMAIMFLDIDHFKHVNDTHGHQAGDAVLRGIANILRENTRLSDIPARYGGEEFAVILPGSTARAAGAAAPAPADPSIGHMGTGTAYEIAEKLRQMIEILPFSYEGKAMQVTVSIGVSSWDPASSDTMTETDLVEIADQNLYRAKKDGRNRVCV